MNGEKRTTIVNEIHHWRRSKLLPEHYCDFLLNLYADEEGNTKTDGSSLLGGGSGTWVRNSNWKVWLCGTLLAVLVVYFVFHFNAFPVAMQISIPSIFILIFYVLGVMQGQKRPIVSYICLGIGAFLMLFIGLRLLEANGLDDASHMVGFLFLCSITWIAAGWLARNLIFSFCGWIGLILIYGWMLYGKLDVISWLVSQASWLPWAAVFGWVGWLVQHRNKRAGLVFFLLSVLLWFMPEAFLIYANGYNDSVQLSITGKLAVAGAAAFLTRKKWIEWVA